MRFEDYSHHINEEENNIDRLELQADGSPKSEQQLQEAYRRMGHLITLEHFDRNLLDPTTEEAQTEFKPFQGNGFSLRATIQERNNG